MQIINSQSQIVEKVLRDKEGRLVRARFYVYEVAGRIKARLLDFSYIETLKGTVTKLVSSFKKIVVKHSNFLNKTLEIVFVSPKAIYFNGSKPRAPTL